MEDCISHLLRDSVHKFCSIKVWMQRTSNYAFLSKCGFVKAVLIARYLEFINYELRCLLLLQITIKLESYHLKPIQQTRKRNPVLSKSINISSTVSTKIFFMILRDT